MIQGQEEGMSRSDSCVWRVGLVGIVEICWANFSPSHCSGISSEQLFLSFAMISPPCDAEADVGFSHRCDTQRFF